MMDMGGPRPHGRGGLAVMERGQRRGFNLRTFTSLKNPGYRWYFAANFCQMASMNMQMLARGWLMYILTGSPLALGGLMLANAAPQLLFSIFGGVIADRLPKKMVMIVGQFGSALGTLIIAVFISLGTVTWVHVVAVAVFQGTIMALMMPSRQSVIPEIVGRDGIMNAVALNTAGMNMNRLLAPAAAGVIIELFGVGGVYYIMTALYLGAVLFLLPLKVPGTARPSERRSVWTDTLAGISYIRGNRTISVLLILTLVAVVLSMPYIILLPVFAKDVLNIGAGKLGILMSLSGAGALAGSVAIASMREKKRGLLFLHSTLLSALALVFFALSESYLLSLFIILFVGLGQAGRMALSNTLLQAYTEEQYLGRVMSVYLMEFGISNVGTAAVAAMAEFVGVQWAIGSTAFALVLVCIGYYVFVPRIRHLD